MNRKAAVVGLVLAAGLAAISLRPAPTVKMGEPAPGFMLANTAGQPVSLSSYRGKLVLVNFWATWCPECRQEFPVLEAAYRKHRAAGFEILAPSVDENGRKAVLPFLASTAAAPTFQVLLSDAKTGRAYGVRALPASFLIGPDGRLLKSYIGALEPGPLENDILQHLPRRNS
jgi:peroxiredoxin